MPEKDFDKEQLAKALILIGKDKEKSEKFLKSLDRKHLELFSSLFLSEMAQTLDKSNSYEGNNAKSYYGFPKFCSNCGYDLLKNAEETAKITNTTVEEQFRSMNFCGKCATPLKPNERLPRWAELMKEAMRELKKEL